MHSVLKCLKDEKEICVCPLGSGFGSLVDLVQLTELWSLILKSVTSVVTTALGLFSSLIDLVQLTGYGH